MFDVTAGGRRLRALNFLLAGGKLAKDYEVPAGCSTSMPPSSPNCR
jgi:hypothetical protein